jgi:hypothetical protein
MIRLSASISLAITLLITPWQAQAATAGLTRFVQIESSKPVFDVLWKYGAVGAAPSGAYGANINAPRSAWYIEEQRAGVTDVIDGVLRHEPETLAEGLKIFHFGLAREAGDGSFPGSQWPFHGPAMFLSEAGPAFLMLRSSPYAGEFASETRWALPRMQKAAYAMVRHVGGPGKIDDTTKNHRYYEAAIALGSVAVLMHDRTLRTWSALYARHAIAMERPDGVMPEDGGHDSGYQALGMVSASRYLTLVATGHLYRSLYAVLQRGEAWELSRIEPDGAVNQSGDTRTVGCKERGPNGQCKVVFYAPIFSALARWAAISGDAHYAAVSYRVWQHSGYAG